jgi:hypothetical protein
MEKSGRNVLESFGMIQKWPGKISVTHSELPICIHSHGMPFDRDPILKRVGLIFYNSLAIN